MNRTTINLHKQYPKQQHTLILNNVALFLRATYFIYNKNSNILIFSTQKCNILLLLTEKQQNTFISIKIYNIFFICKHKRQHTSIF